MTTKSKQHTPAQLANVIRKTKGQASINLPTSNGHKNSPTQAATRMADVGFPAIGKVSFKKPIIAPKTELNPIPEAYTYQLTHQWKTNP